MTYTLKELLANKELRNTLSGQKFAFADGNGVFSALDFNNTNITMLRNLRSAYDLACAQGGEAVLEAVLKGGKTCLVAAPASSPDGLRPIQGVANYSLKTNAGVPTQFASILAVMAALAKVKPDFDAAALTFTAQENSETAEEAEEEDDVPEEVKAAIDAMAALLPARKVSILTKGSHSVLWDETEKTIISLPCEGIEGGKLEEMVTCKPLKEGNADYGWVYQLEEDGPWGWLEAECQQVLPPVFQKFSQLADGQMLLYGTEETEETWRGLLYRVGEQGLENIMEEMERHGAPGLPFQFTPGETPVIEETDMDGLFYMPEQEGKLALLWYANGEKGEPRRQLYICRMEDHILYVKPIGSLSGREWLYPALSLSAANCIMAVHKGMEGDSARCVHFKEWEQENGFGVEETNTWALYAVRKDFMWGLWLAESDSFGSIFGGGDMKLRQLTGYHFTGVEKVLPAHTDNEGRPTLCVLDRFGKKGVYDIAKDAYIIPFEYESIESLLSRILVRRMGFRGELNGEGKWITKLYREG